MLLLAHTGITLGAAYALQRIEKYRATSKISFVEKKNPRTFYREVANKVDYRIILIGSLLPDLIDKPLGNIILNSSLGNGRIYAHTLFFLLLVLAIAVIAYCSKGKVWGFYLLFGTTVHFLLDQMWLTPRTLFWPLMGFGFKQLSEMSVLTLFSYCLNELVIDPVIYVGEIIGGLILICFSIKVIWQRRVRTFFVKGEV